MSSKWADSTRTRRLPPNWRRQIVPRILDRDDHTCRIRLPGCIGRATEVDHIAAGDNHDDANLQAACEPCHRRKSAQEGVTARRRHRQRRDPEPHPGILR